MKPSFRTVLAITALLAACSAPDSRSSVSFDAHHPASPEAADAPAYARSSALDLADATAPPASPMVHADDDAHPADGAQLYTCPMHAEIVTSAPGRCPLCGMQLVPKQEQP